AYRDACLAGAFVVWLGADALLGQDSNDTVRRALLDTAAQTPVLTFFATEGPPAAAPWPTGSRTLVIELAPPPLADRRHLWAAALGSVHATDDERDRLALALARAFQLTEGGIEDAVQDAWLLARGRNPAEPELGEDDLFEASRRLTAGRLDRLARRIEPRTDL